MGAADSTLDRLAVGARGQVASLTLEPDLAAWVEAVGLYVGAEVTVLRRAPLGGPLHVRGHDGAEFALARAVAAAIRVVERGDP